jgi:hypothetical protein
MEERKPQIIGACLAAAKTLASRPAATAAQACHPSQTHRPELDSVDLQLYVVLAGATKRAGARDAAAPG